ncbi:MAG: hypothetical protein ABSC11_13025 [Smithella sp.]|jgi:hypothetical protein
MNSMMLNAVDAINQTGRCPVSIQIENTMSSNIFLIVSCNPQAASLDEYTTFQSERNKKR